MDRFSEQLVERQGDKKASLLKGLIAAGAALIIAVLILLVIWSGFRFTFLCLIIGMGVFWLAAYLWQGLNVEYEYIVTNDDLDIDKISGKRKRKRLISIDLKSVDEFAPYLNETELRSDVTVLADDGTGYDMWYVFIDTDSNGKIAIIFNPNQRTRDTIIGGLAPTLRTKLSAKYPKAEKNEEE